LCSNFKVGGIQIEHGAIRFSVQIVDKDGEEKGSRMQEIRPRVPHASKLQS